MSVEDNLQCIRKGSIIKPFLLYKCCHNTNIVEGQHCSDRDKETLVDNFHTLKMISTSWRIPFELCKLLLLQHHCNVSEIDFFN